jgi:ribonuclease HII
VEQLTLGAEQPGPDPVRPKTRRKQQSRTEPRTAAPRGKAPHADEPEALVTSYEIERELAAAGRPVVAGVDEVGRGAWAGPVVVCAAVVRPGFPEPPEFLTDSKKLTRKRREVLAGMLPDWVSAHALGAASHEEIDALGMTAALRMAAVRALEQLPGKLDIVLLDGSHDYIGSPWPVRTAVKADLRSVSVAAASVIAKVYRDRLMGELGTGHPEFAFDSNAGYPAPVHQEALARLGPTPYHRLSWSYLDGLPRWRHLKKQSFADRQRERYEQDRLKGQDRLERQDPAADGQLTFL